MPDDALETAFLNGKVYSTCDIGTIRDKINNAMDFSIEYNKVSSRVIHDCQRQVSNLID